MSRQVVLWVLCFTRLSYQQQQQKRNIVIIMADDLGNYDLSYKGSDEIPTPNIDALAYNGVIMNRFYTPPLCTPSRSSCMTGKYPFKIGMQHFVIPSDEPWGLALNETIMPQYFKEAGYATYCIGKWHLGFHQEQYTPTHRGFDSFIGYLGPYIDYWDYTLKMFDHDYERGRDMRRNKTNADDIDRIYATDLFTTQAVKTIANHDKNVPMYLQLNHLAPHAANSDFPMQAPVDVIEKFSYIESEKRRTLAAMIAVLDKGVGAVVEALHENGMLENTLIWFYSDNGGPTFGFAGTEASNFPLRGQKHSAWEGGIRVNSILYAPFLDKPGEIRNQFMHVSDILPTVMRLVGLQINSTDLDGIDQWDVINSNVPAVRKEIVEYDDVDRRGSYIYYPYKLVEGSTGYSDWLSKEYERNDLDPSFYPTLVLNSTVSQLIQSIQRKENFLTAEKIIALRNAATIICSSNPDKKPCNTKSMCLFNIMEDPCEKNNLSGSSDALMQSLVAKFNRQKKKVVKSRRKYSDPACDPINFDNHWNWWQADIDT